MAAGGLAIRQSRYADIDAAIQDIKGNAGIKGEMKWSKYRGGKRRAAYEAVVDLVFLLSKDRQAAFHCIIGEFSEFNHKWAEGGSPESSVSRMYFQIALHRLCRFYGKRCAIYIYPDYGNDSRELPQFREIICAYGYQKYQTRPNCVRSIRPTDSAADNLIQAVDIVVGAIAAGRNERKLIGPKAELAEYVLASSGRPDWATDTPLEERFLTVWNFRHQTGDPYRPRRARRHG